MTHTPDLTPTLRPVDYHLHQGSIVGEQYHLKDIAAVRKARHADPDEEITVEAWLVAEPENLHDRMAIKVMVGDHHVAHIKRGDNTLLRLRGALSDNGGRLGPFMIEITAGDEWVAPAICFL